MTTRTVKIDRLETHEKRGGRGEWVELWGAPVDGIAYPNYIVAYTDDPTAQDSLVHAQHGSGLVTVDIEGLDTNWPRIVGVEEARAA